MFHDLLPFWLSLLEQPRRTGAIAPSGRPLAQAMARAVMASPPGHVIELGAGTGAITRALLAHRGQFDSLHLLEQSPRLAECLRRRFPQAEVHTLCASRLDEVHAEPLARVTVVSSIPFRSLRAAERHRILQAIWRLQRKCRSFRLVQYSYGAQAPFRVTGPGLGWSRRETVWANLPPATVWLLSAAPSTGPAHPGETGPAAAGGPAAAPAANPAGAAGNAGSITARRPPHAGTCRPFPIH